MERIDKFLLCPNNPENDDAILRPGRVDCMIHFKNFQLI